MKFNNKEEFWQFVSMCEPGDVINTSIESVMEIKELIGLYDSEIKIRSNWDVFHENGGELKIIIDRNRYMNRPINRQKES